MKKSFITFCALALLATTAPAANAASTTGGESGVSYDKSNNIQDYKYKTIILNTNCNSIYDFIKLNTNSVEFSKKVTEVKEAVKKQTGVNVSVTTKSNTTQTTKPNTTQTTKPSTTQTTKPSTTQTTKPSTTQTTKPSTTQTTKPTTTTLPSKCVFPQLASRK